MPVLVRRAARRVVVVATAVVALGVLFRPGGGASRALDVALDESGALLLLALAVTGVATQTQKTALYLAAGAVTSALYLVSPSAALAVVACVATAMTAAALLATCGLRPRDAIAFAGAALLVPVATSVVVAATGGDLPQVLGRLVPGRPVEAGFLLVSATLAVVVGTTPREAPAKRIAWLLAAVALGAFALRALVLARVASMRAEAFWPEPPLLANALKLDAGLPLYGPPAQLDSYTYSPLLDLAHYALLRPFGLELDVFAHRALVLGDQALAVVVLAAAVVPRRPDARLASAALLALSGFASLVAPAVHPDHPQLLCFAVALALVVAEDRWPRVAWATALLLVTPAAVAFKLSGVGLAAGLAVVFLLERRWRALLVVVASGVLAAGTVPLFDATLGDFRFYALDVQASHPVVWSRLAWLPLGACGFAVAFVAAQLWATGAAALRTRPLPAPARAAIVTAGMGLASLPGYLKYGGRDNNLTQLLVGLVVVLLLLPATRRHSAFGPALALVACLLFRPASLPPSTDAGDADTREVVDAIQRADASGERVLLLIHTIAWIDAGHREVLADRFHSAIELFYGGHPAAEALFDHLESGTYDIVVVPAHELRGGPDLHGQFSERLKAALDRDYVAEDRTRPTLVFRRVPRDLLR